MGGGCPHVHQLEVMEGDPYGDLPPLVEDSDEDVPTFVDEVDSDLETLLAKTSAKAEYYDIMSDDDEGEWDRDSNSSQESSHAWTSESESSAEETGEDVGVLMMQKMKVVMVH